MRLPLEIVRKQALRVGSKVEVQNADDGIMIRVVKANPPHVALADLVRSINTENTHGEAFADDTARGAEIW